MFTLGFGVLALVGFWFDALSFVEFCLVLIIGLLVDNLGLDQK